MGKKALRREARTAAARERDALVREKEREERARRNRLLDEAGDRIDAEKLADPSRSRRGIALRQALTLALALLPPAR